MMNPDDTPDLPDWLTQLNSEEIAVQTLAVLLRIEVSLAALLAALNKALDEGEQWKGPL